MTDNEKLDIVLNYVLANEGGYVNNSADSGGETNYGISAKYHPNEDIKNMTKERAKEIYKNEYAEPLRSVWAFSPINYIYQVVDSAVNCGVSRTKQLVNKISPQKDIQQIRREFYESIAVGNKLQFLKGWLKRVDINI